jgi:cellobiose phosphorylase
LTKKYVTTQSLSNSHGRFDPSGRRYVIHDSNTPTPWVNVVSNGHYGFVVSQSGGGFSWLDNSQLNVLTRWEMDLVRDDHGRFLYLSDLETGEVWSGAPAPCQPKYSKYQCEHTQGRTTISTEHSGIAVEWTMTVAPSDPVEIWRIAIKNVSGRARKLRVSSFFEWCCGVAPDAKREFHKLFITTKHDAKRRAIVARKNMWDVPSKDEREHWNKPWPYVAGHAVGGAKFDADLAIADKLAFAGRNSTLTHPEAMTAKTLAQPGDLNVFGRFGDASAALGGDLTLAAGQTVTLVYTLAIASDEKTVLDLLDKHTNEKAADAAIAGSDALWNSILKPSSVQSGMPDFDLLNSTWLPYQAISGRLWARTGYYQQSGAFGFRDQLQDSQVWLPREPSRTRDQIMLHAAHQFADGSVYHWWHPLAEFGLRTACSDDYLWLPYLTAQYIKETGDWGILDQNAPFVDDATGATLLEHCTRSIARSLARQSGRGLPLIGACDWNDGLSAMGIGGKGESVWLAQWLAQLLGEFAHVVEHGGAAGANSALGKQYRAAREKLIDAVNTHAWDGESGGAWYRAATRDDGRWIGTATNEEGRIFLNTQTWAILSETAPADREEQCWSSVKQHLLKGMGPLLSSPAYTEPDASIGYITRYAPGLRENGGVYMHAATWALAAACKRRDIRSVEKIWESISPPLRGRDAAGYKAEPYVTPGNVDGPDSSTPGKAGWTWYTGSAAWLNKVSLDWVLGMRPEWDGLRIDPCVFPALGRVSATRLWRGRPVRVSFDASEWSANLPPKLEVNGKPHAGNLIRASDYPSDKELNIVVGWGLHIKPSAGTSNSGAAPAGHRAQYDRRD